MLKPMMAQLAESKYRKQLYNQLAEKKKRSSITCLDFVIKIGFTKLVYLLELSRLSQKSQTPLFNPKKPYSCNSTLYKAQKNA